MLDGHLQAVAVADPSVDDAEAALAQHRAHLVGLLEGLPRDGGGGGGGRLGQGRRGPRRGGGGGDVDDVVVATAGAGEEPSSAHCKRERE